MNRIAMCALAAATALALAGCASNGQQNATGESSSMQQTAQANVAQQQNATPAESETTLDGIIAAIEQDFETTQADIEAGLDDAKAKAGGSYADYTANRDALPSWIADTQSKTEALFARTNENAARYYTLLAKQAPSMEWRTWPTACKPSIAPYMTTPSAVSTARCIPMHTRAYTAPSTIA